MKYLILLPLVILAACTDKHGAARALNQAGYSQIHIGGYDFTSCGKGDDYATRFEALGPTGVPVSGAVCSGVFKGHTIRLD